MNKDIEIIKKIEEIFPKRPMKVNRLSEIIMIINCVLGFLLSWLIIEAYASRSDIYHELTTDYKISQNPIKVDGNIRGECKVFTFVTHCSVTISYKNHDIKRKFRFFGSHKISFIGSDKISIIASADDPSLVTIDLAIDKLMNRFLLFNSFIFIFVMIFFCFFVFLIYRSWSIIKIINQINGQKLKPVLVPIHCTFIDGDYDSFFFRFGDYLGWNFFAVDYKIKDSQGKMIKYVTRFSSKSGGPLIISQEDYDGEVEFNETALGIIGETNTTPILLDKQFKRCDFTEQEIQELTNCLSLANKKN